MLARTAGRSARLVRPRARRRNAGGPALALKLECTCRNYASEAGQIDQVEAAAGTSAATVQEESPKIDIKGKGREVRSEHEASSSRMNAGALRLPLARPDRERFMRDRFEQTSSHQSVHPAAGDRIRQLPQDEVKRYFVQALAGETAHPVRDTWRSFEALSLESRKALSKEHLQQVLGIQMARKIRRYGRFAVDHTILSTRAASVLENTRLDETWPVETLADLLDKCFGWQEEVDRSQIDEEPDVEGLLDHFAIVIQGFTTHADLGEDFTNTDILAGVTHCLDLVFRFPKAKQNEDQVQILSMLSDWIRHFWLSDAQKLVDNVETGVRALVEDVCFLLRRADMDSELEKLVLASQAAGLFESGHNPTQVSFADQTHTRDRGLAAIIAYQDKLAQGTQPDQTLYQVVMREFRRQKGISVPFPSLREVAISKSGRWHRMRQTNLLAIDAASPEQIFRLAIEAKDFELASNLYKLLRLHRTITWTAEDSRLFDSLFTAVADYAFTSMNGRNRKAVFRDALADAAQMYLHFRQDTQDCPTSNDISERLFCNILPRLADEQLFRDCLTSYLSEKPTLSIRYATRFFRTLHRISEKSTWKIDHLYNAMACFQRFKEHAVQLEVSAYNFVLRSLAGRTEVIVERSERVFRAITRNGQMPTVSSYELLLGNLSEVPEHAKTILAYYKHMQQTGLEASSIIYELVMEAYYRLDRLPEACQILLKALEQGMRLSSAAIDASLAWLSEEDAEEAKVLILSCREGEPMTLTETESARLRALLSSSSQSSVTAQSREITEELQLGSALKTAHEESKARLAVPALDGVASEEMVIPTLLADAANSKSGGEEQRERAQSPPFAGSADSTFLTTFFTSNVDQEASSATIASPASMPGKSVHSAAESSEEVSTEDEESSPAGKYTPASRPPMPVSFASLAVPAVSQAFSTSTRSALALETESSSTDSHMPSLAAVGSALAALPYYLADLTFPQLSGLYKRYRLEAQAVEREKELQEAIRMQVAQRADVDRWRGWREAGAVPWY